MTPCCVNTPSRSKRSRMWIPRVLAVLKNLSRYAVPNAAGRMELQCRSSLRGPLSAGRHATGPQCFSEPSNS